MSRWVWVCPEERGGIRSYSDALWGGLAAHAPRGSEFLLTSEPGKVASLSPTLIHVQHEYGCFGSKVPGLYLFPRWVREVRRLLPETKIVATAHTVIAEDYRYPVRGRGWQAPLRMAANLVLMPRLARWWNDSSWRDLDAVVVHSKLQLGPVRHSGCPLVREIPHFVPAPSPESTPASATKSSDAGSGTILLFGFVSPEKGQDVVIRALAGLSDAVRLRIAGGVRRKRDQGYYDHCVRLAGELGIAGRVEFSGFAGDSEMDQLYERAQLVIAPFRETTGSGSLAQALARGKPVLASDLPLNREIADRVPESLAFFRSEDPEDCARQIGRLMGDASAREKLVRGARNYAAKYSVEETVSAHLRLYDELGRV